MGRYRYVVTGLPGPVIQDPSQGLEIYYQYAGFGEASWSDVRPLLNSNEDRHVTYLYMCMRFPKEMESAPWQSV